MKTASKSPDMNWERRLQEIATSFRYPNTPDIHAAVRQRLSAQDAHRRLVSSPRQHGEWRRIALAALVALLVLVTLLAVPTVRAAIARFLQVGAITIFVAEADEEPGRSPEIAGEATIGDGEDATRAAVPTALPTKQQTSTREAGSGIVQTPPAMPELGLSTPTRRPTPSPTVTQAPVLEGPLTLLEAEVAAGFPIRLPDAASGLGSPEEVYLQHSANLGSHLAVILVWPDPSELETPRLVLYQIGVPHYGTKAAARGSLIETEVNGRPAYWVEGEHLLQIPDGAGDAQERVVGSVLVWTEGELTYRLEGAPSLAEAVRIAESLARAVED